jgi:hypothetical protein
MHEQEGSLDPFVVPSLREEADLDFDWEERIQVSERARVAFDLAACVLA